MDFNKLAKWSLKSLFKRTPVSEGKGPLSKYVIAKRNMQDMPFAGPPGNREIFDLKKAEKELANRK